ncbi:MAG: hypothetical protein IPI67_17945 [Myxococcales bacterium]|nr:hypothetical protein [Myxococcales bacterium]
MSGAAVKRMLQALCAALALVVLAGLGSAHAHPVSEGRAPSIRAQRRPQALPTSRVSHRLELRLPAWEAGASTDLEGAGGAQRRDSAASNDRGRHQSGKLLPPDDGTPYPGINQPLRWQGRWFFNGQGIDLYDFRNRVWSPELGAFLSPDEFGYATTTGTLWSWPGQNPIAFADPAGLGLAPGDERGPLVFILEMVGLGDTATVVVEHQNSLDSIMAGNVAAAECSANKIMAASASLAASAAAAVVAGAVVKGAGALKWRSTRVFGHTFARHGQGAKSMRGLLGRAGGTGEPQGQWLNNQAAAELLAGERASIQGPASVRIPEGLGQVVLPNGTIVPATRATLIPNPAGGFFTAYPIP